MDTVKMIYARHSVRSYLNKPVADDTAALLREEIDKVNAESGLHIQYMPDASGVFDKLLARFIGWKYVPAYLALVGPDTEDLEEKCGWYGEHLVLFLQSLGLNTCWVGMYRASAVKAEVLPGEKLVLTIALGYGENPGKERKSKSVEDVTDVKEMPDWFRAGIECALLAPTAINQQKFRFTLEGDRPVAAVIGNGPFVKADLGIVKYHFAAGSGRRPE